MYFSVTIIIDFIGSVGDFIDYLYFLIQKNILGTLQNWSHQDMYEEPLSTNIINRNYLSSLTFKLADRPKTYQQKIQSVLFHCYSGSPAKELYHFLAPIYLF